MVNWAFPWVNDLSTVEYPNISESGTWDSIAHMGPSSWDPTIIPRRWFREPMTGP